MGHHREAFIVVSEKGPDRSFDDAIPVGPSMDASQVKKDDEEVKPSLLRLRLSLPLSLSSFLLLVVLVVVVVAVRGLNANLLQLPPGLFLARIGALSQHDERKSTTTNRKIESDTIVVPFLTYFVEISFIITIVQYYLICFSINISSSILL